MDLAEAGGARDVDLGEIKVPGEANLKEYSKLFSPPENPEEDEKSGEEAKE